MTEASIASRAPRARAFGPAYKTVDTCAGEFPSSTPYLYSSYDEENEAGRAASSTVVILGSGPNRIGQGVEFDYCCVRAALAFREMGYRTIMVNSNPETVSTDFDISDTLYFEPLTLEDVLEIVALEQPIGVVVQLGGQTPLRLARGARARGRADPRHLARCDRPGRGPRAVRGDRAGAGRARSRRAAPRSRSTRPWPWRPAVGYPVLVRPSYVLGGRAMEIVYDDSSLRSYFERAARVAPEHPVLIDRFLEDAFEADVDAICRREPVRDRRRHAAHRGRRHPLRRLGLRAAAVPDHRGRRSRRCGGTPGRSRCASVWSA